MKTGKTLSWYLNKNLDITGMGLEHIGSGRQMGRIYGTEGDFLILDPSFMGERVAVPTSAGKNYRVVEKYSPQQQSDRAALD